MTLARRAALAIVGLIIWVVVVEWVTVARAHEFFTDKYNPQTGVNCCNNSDCLVIDDKDWSMSNGTVSVHWRDGKDYSMPSSQMQPSEDTTGRAAACVWNGELRCFFAPLGY